MREYVLYVNFMETHTPYYVLERDICLKILEGYSVGTLVRHILHTCWDRLRMVYHTDVFYRAAFQGFLGVTQGGPLSPIILNVVVETVLRHWILLVEGGAGCQDGWGKEVLCCATFSHRDDILVASTDPVWLHGAFDTLARFFDRVGLQTNAGETVGMLCRP